MLLAATTSSVSPIVWVISFIVWILIISWTAAIARRKGRSPFIWGLLAFFFSIITLIVIALMPSRRSV